MLETCDDPTSVVVAAVYDTCRELGYDSFRVNSLSLAMLTTKLLEAGVEFPHD